MASAMQILTSYPEIYAALLLSLFLFMRRGKDKDTDRNQNGHGQGLDSARFAMPQVLAEPAAAALALAPAGYLAWLQKKLIFAGLRNNTYFGTLASAKIYPLLLSAVLFLFVHPAVALLTCLAAFFAADIILSFIVSKRQKAIRDALPQVLDLMVLCVDAGLGLDATIHKVASEPTTMAAAINEELMTLGRDVLLGMNRDKAYQELYNRTGVDELRSLSASLNQSSQLGISISKVLRSQAEFLRTKLGQKAEEKAAKLPVLMAFPLWFCIMPALMVLVLAPSLIIFFQQVKPMPGLGQ